MIPGTGCVGIDGPYSGTAAVSGIVGTANGIDRFHGRDLLGFCERIIPFI
jgi:hypothetical protein